MFETLPTLNPHSRTQTTISTNQRCLVERPLLVGWMIVSNAEIPGMDKVKRTKRKKEREREKTVHKLPKN